MGGRRLPPIAFNMLPFNPFNTPEHEDFTLVGGRPAALLVHGFPGTPIEMSPLAEALNGSGWTCRGLLLPGFGPDLDNLPLRRADDWLSAIMDALASLRQAHAPLLLAGNSMGAALCIAAAASQPVDGLVLLAPFWKMPTPLWGLVPTIKRLFPTIQPFRLQKIDFDAPHIREGLSQFVPPGMSLDDPQIRRSIQDFAVPVSIFDEMRKAGLMGYNAAPQVTCPTLVIQGLQDEAVLPVYTRQVVKRLGNPATSLELRAGHDLPFAEGPAFAEVCAAVLDFASDIQMV